MKSATNLRCTRCGTFTTSLLRHICARCGGTVEPHYSHSPSFVGKSMLRFRGLLPFKIDPVVADLLASIPRTPLATDTYRGSTLYLKDETRLPTASTKDRMAVAALGHMREQGVREFVLSSTGNSSSSFIHWTGKLAGEMHCHVFAAKEAAHRVRYGNPHATVHLVEGDFVKAGKVAREFAEKKGLHWEGGFFNFGRREGLKTAYLEAFEQMDYDVDVVIQTVSSGMGILGGFKGANELRRFGLMNKRPAFVCVQQDTCMPMVRAHEMGLSKMHPDLVEHNPRGLAEAVLRGDPTGSYPYIKSMVEETRGTFVGISQSSLVKAKNEIASLGIKGCHAAAASYGAAKHLRDTGFISQGDRVLVMITGADHFGQ